MAQIIKSPRTYHIEGSRFQPGDEDLDSVPFSAIAENFVVIEEKVDGANAAISFSPDGQMLLQSRGHYLTGGPREKHFNLFKQWAYSLSGAMWDVLGTRYILYGEWLYQARIRIVYLEVPFEEILRRNRSRMAMVPEAVIYKLARKLEVPEPTEAHEVQWVVNT
jgi:hypothetical protein